MAVLIGVVGVTGSGKSSFIKRLTLSNDISVGNGLESETKAVEQYKFQHQGVQYVLVDSPGFDDSNLDDEDIFHLLASWLESSFREGHRLNGLLYLHPIISNREKGSEIRNLRMFKKLCGDDNFKNVILGLTFCDQESRATIEARQRELIDTPEWWGDMVNRGSRVCEIPLDREGCLALLETFVPQREMTLQIQSELVERGVAISQTAAAQTVLHRAQLTAIRAREKVELKEIHVLYQKKMQKAVADHKVQADKERAEFDRTVKRQALEERRLAIQKQLQQEHDRTERLHRQQEEEEEEEMRKQTEALSKELTKVKLENDKLERRLKDRKAFSETVPKIVARALDVDNLISQVEELRTKNLSLQPWIEYRWLDKIPSYYASNASLSFLICSGFCDRCFATFRPDGIWHECKSCSQNSDVSQELDLSGGPLMICPRCFDSGMRCFDEEHKLRARKMPSIPALKNCRKGGPNAAGDRSVICDSCDSSVGSIFFHCCKCDNDEFDLCVQCWGKGGTCRRKREHLLHLVGTCPKKYMLAQNNI